MINESAFARVDASITSPRSNGQIYVAGGILVPMHGKWTEAFWEWIDTPEELKPDFLEMLQEVKQKLDRGEIR